MPGVTRTLTNDGDPIIFPSGVVAANKTITFQLVDFEKRQPISLFDAASDGGEYVVGSVVTATIGATGYFSVNLWPNSRGEAATLYKVLLPGTTVKPFYIQISEGAGAQTLLSAKTAVDAVAPQTLSLFDALLAQIIAVANTATSLVTRTTNGLMSWQDKVKLDDLTTVDLSDLAPLDSPALTGVPTAPTAASDVSNTQIATTSFVKTVVAALTKVTFGLGNVDNTSDTSKPVSISQQQALDLKAPVAAPSFTGILKSAGNALFGKTVDDGLAKLQSSDGITLGNTANASPLVLDYYAEGTWTPVGNNITIGYSNALWTRIGRVVCVTCELTWPATADTTGAQVAGLPFLVRGSAGAAIGYALSTTRVRLFADSSTTLYAYDENGVYVQNAQLSNAVIRFSMTYHV